MSLNRHLALALIAAAGALSAGAAAAHPDVRWAVNVNAAPVAVQVASDRGYGVVAMPVVNRYGYPVYREPTRWDRDADGIPDRYEYRARHHHHHRHDRCEPDRDRDGVPDRHDRRPHDPTRW